MSEAAVGRRESAKEGRRQALVEATRASLTSGEFSMRRVADLAQVSEVTPYNLFGSKAGLLAALYERMIRESETRLPSTGEVDPLSRIFAAIDGFRENLERHPAFYRAFFAARLESRGGKSYATTNDEGVEYWHRLIGAVIDAGQIRGGRSADLIARHFIHLLSGAVQEWIDGAVDPDEWCALVAHGFALVALPLASPEAAAILRRRMADAARGLRPMGEKG